MDAIVLKRYEAAVRNRLDSFARGRGYDGILAACSYATSGIGAYKAEGRYALKLRDATWKAFYETIGATEEEAPPELEDVLAALPTLEWPGEN
jgi:hypothetical protein